MSSITQFINSIEWQTTIYPRNRPLDIFKFETQRSDLDSTSAVLTGKCGPRARRRGATYEPGGDGQTPCAVRLRLRGVLCRRHDPSAQLVGVHSQVEENKWKVGPESTSFGVSVTNKVTCGLSRQ